MSTSLTHVTREAEKALDRSQTRRDQAQLDRQYKRWRNGMVLIFLAGYAAMIGACVLAALTL